MKTLFKILIAFMTISSQSFAQTTERSTPPSNTQVSAVKIEAPVKKPVKNSRMIVSFSLGSFQETMITLLNGQNIGSKANYFSQSLWFDYEKFRSRAGFGLSTRLHMGQVDIEKVQGVNYPRSAWNGIELVPQYIYRFNAKSELLGNGHLLQKTIQGIGTSYSLGLSAEYRIRLLPKLSLSQSIGTYGISNAPMVFLSANYFIY